MSIDLAAFTASIVVANELPPPSHSDSKAVKQLRDSPPTTTIDTAQFLLSIEVDDEAEREFHQAYCEEFEKGDEDDDVDLEDDHDDQDDMELEQSPLSCIREKSRLS